MPEYQYQAKQGPEKLIEGIVEAPTEAAAIERISQLGYVPVKISVRDKKNNAAAFPILGPRWRGGSRLFLFSNTFARLIKAGIPVLKALHLLATHEKDSGIRMVLESVERDIHEGRTLSRAMELYPAMFSAMYVSVIRAGEVSGSLQQALMQMAAYYKKQEEFASKLRRAMAYPVVLFFAGISSLFFIITFIVPKLEKVFTNVNHVLPLPTRIILGLSTFMQHYWIFVIGVAAALIFLLPWILKERLGSHYFDSWKLRLPFFRDFLVKVEFSRFSRTLGLCFSSGLSFLEALRVAIPVVNNAVIRKSLEECYQNVEKGNSFGQALKKYAFFPDLTTSLISIGEESGKVEETLTEIADVYDQEVDEILIHATTYLEPLMILFVGGIIGFIVMAVLLPIFEMNAVF